MTLSKENFAINSTSLINIAFSLFPISFIIGNLATNIVFLLFCCLGIFHLRSKIFTIKFNFPLKIIFLFFLLVLFSTTLNFLESLYFGEYENSDLIKLIKSVLFFRFFVVLLIVYLLSELNIINYKYFFVTAAIFPILISADVIFQYIFGFNIIGMQGYDRHNSSFFGDELISGGYIQNFSFFSILFLTNLVRKNNIFLKIILITLVISILSAGIILSGNRMPFVLFLLGLFSIFIFGRDLKKIILISCCTIFIIFGFIFSSDPIMKMHYGGFYLETQRQVVSLQKQIENNFNKKNIKKETQKEEKWEEEINEDPELHPYKKLVLTAIETWKPNKILGNGIKSFRIECRKIIIEQNRGLCSNHPHNYYLEILTELGIVGFVLVLTIALTFIIFLIKNYKLLRNTNLENLFLLAAILSLFLATFPFKSSGSIFTTNNATYVILMSSILLSYKKLLQKENFG